LLVIAAKLRADRIFVGRARAKPWHKQLPNAAIAPAHGVTPLVPFVEIASHRYQKGVGRPDGEADARHALRGSQVRAQGAEAFTVRAFAMEVDLEVRQKRREAVRILDL